MHSIHRYIHTYIKAGKVQGKEAGILSNFITLGNVSGFREEGVASAFLLIPFHTASMFLETFKTRQKDQAKEQTLLNQIIYKI